MWLCKALTQCSSALCLFTAFVSLSSAASCTECEYVVLCQRLISFFALVGSLASTFGPREAPGFGSGENTQLFKTVLQDSINLLEQVGWSSGLQTLIIVSARSYFRHSLYTVLFLFSPGSYWSCVRPVVSLNLCHLHGKSTKSTKVKQCEPLMCSHVDSFYF